MFGFQEMICLLTLLENIGVSKVIIVKMEPKSSSYLAEQYVTNSHN